MSAVTRMGLLGAAVAVAAWCGVAGGGGSGPGAGAAASGTPAAASAGAVSAAVSGAAGSGVAASVAAGSPRFARVPSRLAPESVPAVLAAAVPAVDPGTLPQTRVLPTTSDAAFQARLRALWQGIVDDDPVEARPFFFPKAAYVQLKALQNAAGDFDYRLLGYFDLDVHAAHRLLGSAAGRAQLVGMEVPGSRAEWMWPGSEENRIPYFRVYGSRVTYSVDGRRHSFGVFSMLSWRGQWYAVHFGPWPRWERYGDVYQAR